MPTHTTCPVVSRNIETFTSFVNVGGESQKMTFDRPILWIQESETKIQYLHGGKVLKEGPVYSDYYGYLTSFVPSREDDGAAHYAKEFEVDQDSSLEIRMLTQIHKIPLVETEEDRAYNAQNAGKQTRQYSHLPDDYRKEQKCEHSPSGLYYPQLEKVLVAESVTWSSKLTPEENKALAEAFRAEWAVNLAPAAPETGCEP